MTEVVMSREEWLKKACTRKHLDDSSLQDLLRAVNVGSRLRPEIEGPYGPMNVFREFIARKNSIEYTVYFYLPDDETKYRLDLAIPVEDIDAMEDAEKEIHAKVFKMIEEHEYRKAVEAVQ